MNPTIISIALAVIAVASLASAVFLQWQDLEAQQAWAAFIASFSVLAGQQMESPTAGRGVGK